MHSKRDRMGLAVGVLLLGATTIASAASLDKAFAASAIASGEATTLTFTITNPAGAPALTTVTFVDTLPSGLVVANPSSLGGTCANAAAATTATAGSGTISTTNLQVSAGPASCTVTVQVTNATGQFNPSCAGNPSAFTNAAGNVAVTPPDSNAVTSSCLVVTPPTIAKAFAPTTIADGGVTVLTFTVTNPAGAPAITNVGFVDQLPSGMRVAANPKVDGTCANATAGTTASPGGTTITTANLQVPAGASSCTVTVQVTNAPGQGNGGCGSLPSGFTNASGNLTLTNVADATSPACVVVTGVLSATTSTPVPTLRDGVLALLALVLAGLGARVVRRRPR